MSNHVHMLHSSSIIHIRTASLTWRKASKVEKDHHSHSSACELIIHFLLPTFTSIIACSHALSSTLSSSRSGLPPSFEEAASLSFIHYSFTLVLSSSFVHHHHLMFHKPPFIRSSTISGPPLFLPNPLKYNNPHSSTFCHPTSTTTFTHSTSCSHTFIHPVIIHVSFTWGFPRLKQ